MNPNLDAFSEAEVVSFWRNPVPSNQNSNFRVAVYYRDTDWIPLVECPLPDAVRLHYKLKNQGPQVFIFPPSLKANAFAEVEAVFRL